MSPRHLRAEDGEDAEEGEEEDGVEDWEAGKLVLGGGVKVELMMEADEKIGEGYVDRGGKGGEGARAVVLDSAADSGLRSAKEDIRRIVDGIGGE